MDLAAVGQLYALVIAIVTPIAALGGVYRTRKWSYAVLAGQVIVWLEIGAVLYVLDPSPVPSGTPLLAVAFMLLVVDVGVMAWTIYRRRQLLRSPVTLAQVDRANDRGLISRVLTIGVVVLVLLNFKPWVGAACLVANAVWLVLWIPTRMRTYRMAVAAEIRADPAAIFPYLIDPMRWKFFRASRRGVVVSIRPDGPLANGSEIVTRMTLEVGRRLRPYVLDSTSVVTEVVPDRSYTTVWRDRPSERATTSLRPLRDGSRISFELVGVQPFRPASMGTMLDIGSALSSRQTEMAEAYARLKQTVEAPPSQ